MSSWLTTPVTMLQQMGTLQVMGVNTTTLLVMDIPVTLILVEAADFLAGVVLDGEGVEVEGAGGTVEAVALASAGKFSKVLISISQISTS